MKVLPGGMQAHLDGGVTTLCWCWAVTRRDGVTLGFTDHDRALTFDGVAFAAVTGFSASEVQSSLGLAVDNLTVLGALSSDAITETDLAAGLYDGARVSLWRVNWADTAMRILMRAGHIGEVQRGPSAFQAEIRGLAHILNQPVGRVYGHMCDAALGDARCGLSLAALTATGVVAAVTDARRFAVTGLGAYAGDLFACGKITFTSGVNTGREGEVKRHAAPATGVYLELWQPMPDAPAPGDAFTVTQGCDKQFATCRDRFDNTTRFRGFPHMPGNDALLAPPGPSQPMDGGSRYGN